MHDIRSKEDIIIFVNRFYKSVKKDDLIGPVFAGSIGDDSWDKHLVRMYSFWNTVLFGQPDYRGNPFSHHINLDIRKEHFDRWVSLFEETIHSSFQGVKADEAILRATKMRIMFEYKLDHINGNPNVKTIL